MSIYVVGIETIAPMFIATLRSLFPCNPGFESSKDYDFRIFNIYKEIITQLTLILDYRRDQIPRRLLTIPNMEYFRSGDERYIPIDERAFVEACRSFGWQYCQQLYHHVPLLSGEDYIVEQVTGTYVTLRKVITHHAY